MFYTAVCCCFLLVDWLLDFVAVVIVVVVVVFCWLIGRKEGNDLFNDALNTFYLRLYGVRHMVKDHSDSKRGNLLLPYRLLFSINSKGSYMWTT